MQFNDADKLRESKNGSGCKHTRIEKEYYLGTHTGDYVCSSCGKNYMSRNEWEKDRSQK